MSEENFKALMDVLPPKQQFFVREWLANGQNGKLAYRAAGYKASSDNTAEVCASKLLRTPQVAAAVQAAMDRRAKKLDITAESILASIIETRDRCKQGTPVLDREGNPTGEWRFDANAALKADELLGKHIKLFTEKVEHSGSVTYVIETGVPDGGE